MQDIQLLEDHVSGLNAKLQELIEASGLFKKAQGLHEEAVKAASEKIEKAELVVATKKELAELREKKRQALKPTAEGIASKMSAVLPEGNGIFEIQDDGDVWIGWQRPDGARGPWAGLSGGQRVSFDQAISYALLGRGEKVIILEGSDSIPSICKNY